MGLSHTVLDVKWIADFFLLQGNKYTNTVRDTKKLNEIS